MEVQCINTYTKTPVPHTVSQGDEQTSAFLSSQALLYAMMLKTAKLNFVQVPHNTIVTRALKTKYIPIYSLN